MFNQFINTVVAAFISNQLPSTFTLAELHQAICLAQPELKNLSYKEFRNMLYQNPTNKTLSSSMLVFESVTDNGHIDQNIYQIRST